MSAPGTYSGAGKTGLGSFTQEDDDVAGQVAKAAASTSPVMEGARQAGIDAANSRGLLNTSIAGGASEAEALKVALPIGQQQAKQASDRNLSNQTFEQTNETASQGNQSQERIAASNQKTQQEIADAQNLSQERISAGNQGTQRDIAAGNVAGQERMTAATNAAEMERSMANINSNENISKLDAESKLALQQMTTDSQERIANMNVSANQQDKATSAAATASNIYASMVNAIAQNPNIPADARTALMTNARNMLNANISLVEQLYNIDLNWDVSSFTPTPTDNTTAPATDNYGNGGGTGLLDFPTDTGGTTDTGNSNQESTDPNVFNRWVQENV